MKVVRKSEREEHANSPECVAYEYPLGAKDINGAVIKLTGRYPAEGRVTNTVCRELVYVIAGQGKLVVEGGEQALAEGDVALIEPGEKFFFDGAMEMFMPCTPAWYPEQHVEVD